MYSPLVRERRGSADNMGSTLRWLCDEDSSRATNSIRSLGHGVGNCLLVAFFCALREHVTCRGACKREDGWSGTAQVRAVRASVHGRLDHWRHVGKLGRALWLVKGVLRGVLEVGEVTGIQGIDKEGCPGDVVDRLLVRQRLGEHSTGHLSFANGLGNEDDGLKTMWGRDPRRQPAFASVHSKLDATVNCRSHIVRVALDPAGELEERLVPPHRHPGPREHQPGQQARGNARRRRTQPSCEGDAVVALETQRRHFHARLLESGLYAENDQV
mmetsp:Transcript_5818/g.11532  ORF Transcript_5818/g.11532 Transcript_5818/m.11532 type:complete len:271 (-) Transcript_5818:384-1196(-)